MQIYRFSLIFHSISELNKEKQPVFAKNFADAGRRIIKVGVNFSEDRRSLESWRWNTPSNFAYVFYSLKTPYWVVVRNFRTTTFPSKFVYTSSTHLYPHTHEGCDQIASSSDTERHCFNPHTHEGCDAISWVAVGLQESFNPHTHEGCDFCLLRWWHPSRVSIHTPTKGVTVLLLQRYVREIVSIHTPTKGVTFQYTNGWHKTGVSIHTPTKGVT